MRHIKRLCVFIVAVPLLFLAACSPKTSVIPTSTTNYQLSTSIAPVNSGTISPAGGTYSVGANVTLIATPANYYKFNGWGGDISGNTSPITIKMESNKSVVASFTKIQFSLNLTVDNIGNGTVDPVSGKYDAGSQVKITATAASGYRFDHWAGVLQER